MKAVLKTFRLTCALLVAIMALVVISANAQQLMPYHPPIAVTGTNVPTIQPYSPSGPSLSVPSVRPAVSRAALLTRVSCAPASSQPAPIIAIVIALKCDPDLIFEYVYNNIEFEPLYGSNKGPLGTLLDRRGDDADQAILLVTLWNVAGYTQTGYQLFGVPLTGTEIASWLNVQNDATAIENLLTYGGIPWLNASANPDGTLASIDVYQFYAALNLGGTWYFFDPAFKYHTILSGVSSLASALGYTRSQFLSDAGGTIGSGSISISNVNRAALRADLTTYANNLVNYINQNNLTWSVGNVIGGKIIQPLVGSPIRLPDPGITPSSTFAVDCPYQSTTVECRTYVTITMPGASSSQAIKLYTDQVYGHRITVFSVPSGSNYIPTLLIDGAVPSCVGQGSCTNVGTAQGAGTTWSIPVTVVEPNQGTGPSCTTGVTACKTLTVVAGGSYLINTGVGQVGRGMPEYHRQLLARARAAGNADTSELVLGESLAATGYAWLAEHSAVQQMADQFCGTTTLYFFGVGITAQQEIQQTGYQGPHFDLPTNVLTPVPQQSNGPTTTIGSYTYPTALLSAFFTDSEAASGFESAVLEQTQAPVSGMTAASTMKIVDANMNSSYSGALQTTFFADGTTSAGQAAYANTIEPAISSQYSSSDLSTITTAVNDGAQVLIPKNGMLAVGVWNGAGYTQIFPGSSDAITVKQLITGDILGGASGENVSDQAPNTQVTFPLSASTDTVPQIQNTIPARPDPEVLEPVDAVTGAYIYRHDDLKTGSGKFPYALPFSRTYLSSSGTYLTTTSADAGMGNGWAHNYSASAQVESDPYIGMGSADSPAVSAATSIAALYVMQDLLSATPTAQTMTISSMVARWFTDQLTGNVVQVTQPNTTEEFVALPHGDGPTNFAFNPPPGSSVRLTQVAAGQYTYQRKDAVTLNFGPTPAGALQGWTFPSGISVNLTYSGSQLTRIANNIGRSLSLTYSGNDIATVSDDTGRSVSYGYDSHHNLASFTDPLGANTLYFYDFSGTYDTFAHLTQIVYPFRPSNDYVTNWYDQLGRVIQQANANGSTSNFYFAGSRSELIDALGDRHVTYQTDRGKVIKDAYVLSSSFGDVFNDTPQSNGVVNVTANQYDGLDRLTLTALPEGGTTAYSYAAANPWANNIAAITRTAKPGSPLSPLTTSFAYHPIYNKPTQVTDPLGLITTMSYDGSTGNLLSTMADAGASPHFNALSLFTYDAHGRVLTATDPDGVGTVFSYDSFENLSSQVADSGGSGHLNAKTIFGYDNLGNVVSRTDPNGNAATMSYDADRRLLTTTAPAPFGAGSPALVQTSNAYDADGHLLSVTRANGASNAVTRMSYTATGQVRTVTDPNGNVTTNAYDADDRLQSVTDPLYRQTVYAYDAMSRRISVSNPAIQSNPLLQQSYTPDGLIGSLSDANGNTTTFTPDGFDRLATTTYPGGSTENLTYDADGNVLTRKTRAGATIAFSYDTLNRLATKAPPSQATVTYAYDQASHLIGVGDNSAAITTPAASASYAETLAYDQLNRPLTANWSPAPSQATPSATSASFAFGYDATNRRIGQSATDSSWWSYPAAAAKVSYTANALNQYTAVGAVTPSYDGNGDLTSDGSFTYGYDAENRMTSATGAGLTASYAYDAQSRRKSKTVNGTTTIYVTDADNREVLEYSGTGAVQNWYSFAIGPDAVLNQINVAASTRATLIPDIQGSITGTLDAGSGTLTKTGYQTFGENPSLTVGSYQYTARRFDPETAGSASQPCGLYYYRTRTYSPCWGRFFQVDTIGYVGGDNNLYAYVGNDPLNNTDPNGTCGPLIGNCIGGVIGGISGGIAGALAGYHATGTSSGAWIGGIAGFAVGAGIGFASPWAVSAASAAGATIGGSAGAGIGTAGGVLATNAFAGASGAVATDYAISTFTNGQVDLRYDITTGVIVGLGVSIPEAAASGLAVAGGAEIGVLGEAALTTDTALLGIAGAIVSTCSPGSGCGPSTTSSSGIGASAPPPSNAGIGTSPPPPSTQTPSTEK